MTNLEIQSYRDAVLAGIRRGSMSMPDLTAQKIEHQKIIEANRRASVARAQAARLKAKRQGHTSIESSPYFSARNT